MKLLQNAPVANDPKRHFATIDYRTAKDLFDYLIGAAEQSEWECDAKRLGGLHVDD